VGALGHLSGSGSWGAVRVRSAGPRADRAVRPRVPGSRTRKRAV